MSNIKDNKISSFSEAVLWYFPRGIIHHSSLFTGIWVVAKKDFREMINSPIAYVLGVIFMLVTGYFFAQPLFVMKQANIAPLMDIVPMILVFLVPAVTMRSFADEHKSGTFEILATLPLNTYEIVIGKYLACVALISSVFMLTFIYPVMLEILGEPDWGAVFGAYFGHIFLIAALASIGIFISSLTRNQVIAYLGAWMIGFIFFMAGKTLMFFPYPISEILNFIGFDAHMENISRGVLDSRDLIYFLSLAALFLCLPLIKIEAKLRAK
ncbi:ABC transporter permease subunit [Elusimicrobiota bacterium]